MKTAVLLLHCADTKGIVYRVSQFIYELGGNILHAEQHREELDSRFFMRVLFDYTDVPGGRAGIAAALAPIAAGFGMETRLGFSEDRKRIAVMVSKYDHCLYDLFLRQANGEIAADIALVLSNHPDLAPVAQAFGAPFHCIPAGAGGKEAAEAQALALLEAAGVDLVVLARYMQILTPRLIAPYRNRIINVHHGFLPAFKGARPYHQAYEYGVKIIGATSHYVTEDLDMGPIIEQETKRVNHGHSVGDLVAMGRDIEKRVLAAAVKAHLEDRIMLYRRRTIVFE